MPFEKNHLKRDCIDRSKLDSVREPIQISCLNKPGYKIFYEPEILHEKTNL